MIEVNSGKQQLKTAYSSQNGAHRESGGEIHRDEVPLLYQQYVERYFEQVRRPELPPTGASAPKLEAAPKPAPTAPARAASPVVVAPGPGR